jgi:hypothetical protein
VSVSPLHPACVATGGHTIDAARALGWAGTVVLDVPLLGQVVTVVADIDAAEHDRRRRLQTGAMADYALLDRVANLPCETTVRVPDGDWLGRAAALGAVETEPHDHRITRVARRPCQVIGVLRQTSRWLPCIQQMSLFAPLATRAVVLSDRVRDRGAAAMEASSLGVGLVRHGAAGMTVVVPPEPAVPRLSTGHWLMTETVYSAWLAQNEGDQEVSRGRSDGATGTSRSQP